MKKNLEYTVVENKVGFILNLILDPLPFPTPTFHEWNTSNVNVTLKNNGVDFDIVTRKHADIYSLTVSNYHLCDKTRLIGTDTGNFTLNVICKFLVHTTKGNINYASFHQMAQN